MDHDESLAVVDGVDALAQDIDGTGAQVLAMPIVAAISRSEVEAQLAAAHQFPRSIKRFLAEATGLATVSVEVAESCIYTLPRDGKAISGPSVRLAEVCASSYGNLQVAARIVAVEEKEVVAQGMAWDMEKNLRCVVETRRRITTRSGRRFSDDMITVTGNAAASIALRNAIFRVVPRAYVDSVYERVRKVAVGKAETLAARRVQVLERLQKLGATRDRVFARLDVRGEDDITLEHIETLIGLGTAVKSGDMAMDDAFPAPAPTPASAAEPGRRVKLGGKAKSEHPHDPETGEVTYPEPGSDG